MNMLIVYIIKDKYIVNIHYIKYVHSIYDEYVNSTYYI